MYHFIKINILNTSPHKDWYMNICRSFMQNSPKVETIHRSSIRGGYMCYIPAMEYCCVCTGKAQPTDTCNIMNKSQGH